MGPAPTRPTPWRAAQGDVRAALAALKIPRKTFYDKIARHGIDLDAYRPRDRP